MKVIPQLRRAIRFDVQLILFCKIFLYSLAVQIKTIAWDKTVFVKQELRYQHEWYLLLIIIEINTHIYLSIELILLFLCTYFLNECILQRPITVETLGITFPE